MQTFWEGGMQTFWEEDNAMEGFPGSSFDNFSPRAQVEFRGIGRPSGEIALHQKLQLLVEGSEMNWTYAIFWRTLSPSTADGNMAMGWGDGYCKSPKDSEINAIKQAKRGSDVDKQQYERHMFLHGLQADAELQALLSGDGNGESYREHVTTDTEWLYVLSTFAIFEPTVETFATRNHVWLLTTEAEDFANKNYVWLNESTPSNVLVNTRGDLLTMADIQSLVYVQTGSGVVELGSTELLPERFDIIENIKMRFLERNDGNDGDDGDDGNDRSGIPLSSHFLEQESFSLPLEFPCPPSADTHGLRLQQELHKQFLELVANATSSAMQVDELDSTAATNTNVDSLDCLSSDEFDLADNLFDNEQNVGSNVEPESLALEVIKSTFFGAKEKTKPSAHASEQQQQQPHIIVNAAGSLHFHDARHVIDMDNDSQAGDLTTTSTPQGSHEDAKCHQGFPPSKQWRNLEATDALAAACPPSHMDSEQEVELEPEATYYGELDTTIPLGVEECPPRKRRGRKPKDDRQGPMSHKEAESLRRKKMKKQETALRAVVPNVSKADRASLITAAISHIRKLESDLAAVQQQKSELEAQQRERSGAHGESTGKSRRSSVQQSVSVGGSSMSSGRLQKPIQMNVDVFGVEALIRIQLPKSCGPANLLNSLEDLKLEVQHVKMTMEESIVDHTVLVKMGKDNVYTGEQLLGALNRIYCFNEGAATEHRRIRNEALLKEGDTNTIK